MASQIEILEDLYLILTEVRKDIFPILEKDPETAEFLRQAIIDYKLSLYFLLKWINSKFKPQNILYPASGFDRIPKIVFGKDSVIHTSLENLQDGGKRYFDELGDGVNIIADNHNLPFESSIFDLILLLDSPFEIIGEPSDEILRVLSPGGLIVLTRNIFQEDFKKDRVGHYANQKELKIINLPSKFQKKGESKSELFVLRKI